MKRSVALILLVLALITSMVGCIKEDDKETDPAPSTTQSTVSSTQRTEQTTASTGASSTQSSPEIARKDLLGTWQSVYRKDNVLYFQTLTFFEDGTVKGDPTQLANVYYAPLEGEEGWYTPPKGWPTSHGVYTFDGSKITITYTHHDYGEMNETEIIPVRSIRNGRMTTGDAYGVYVYAKEYIDGFALCDLLGVDYSVG